MGTLNDAMEFDHVIEVHADGTITDGPAHLYAPELQGEDESLSSMAGQDWELFSHGYTGQYGYNGPVLHSSEYIGKRLERDILARPAYYVAIVCNWAPDDDDEESNIEGWAIATLPSPETQAWEEAQ